MMTYDDLKNCAVLAQEAKNLRENMERMRSLAEYGRLAGSTVGGTGQPLQDKVGEGASALADMLQQMEEKASAYLEHAAVVTRAIDALAHPNYRTILRLRYVEGLRWEDICGRAHYSMSWAKELHRRALEQIIDKDRTQKDDQVC